MSIEQKTLPTVLSDLMTKVSRELNCSIPAIIQKYDAKTQKASVKVNIQRVYQDSSIDVPILSNVPVMWATSGQASMTFPVKKGDGCLVIFCDVDITNYLLGGDNIKPQTTRSHSLNDAVVLMGLNPFSKAVKVENGDDVLLQYAGSKIRLKPNGVVQIESAKEVNIKTENVVINCTNATVKATGAINTETPLLTQKGNLKIEGDVEVTGTSLIAGALTTQNGITNSGANLVSNNKTFETHTHTYNDVAQVIANGTPATLIKAPSSSGVTQ